MLSGDAHASTGANTGLTGLWEYPTAEIPDDGTGRFGLTNASPYGFYFLDLSWLPWLEVNARFSTFSTKRANPDPNGRRYMDKAIDLKAMLWHSKDPENWLIPSIAFGVVDMMGTELMKAWYGVATWRAGNFAVSIGYGTDRLNGVYGGIEWDIADWLTFKAEYSPLDYNYDVVGGGRVLNELPSEKYNLGFVLKTSWGMQGSVSWQRGDEFVFGISQRIDLKGPFMGNARKNYDSPGEARIPDWNNINSQELILRLKSGLEQYVRVRDVDIKLEDSDEGHRLLMSYENYGYSSHAEAMTRILVVLAAVMPETDELILIHKNAGIPVVQASFPGSLLFDIRSRSLRDEEDALHSAVFTWSASDIEDPDEEGLLSSKARHELKAMVVYEPRLDQTIWETYMDRWDIDLIYNGRYSQGWGSVIDVRFPVIVNSNTEDGRGLWWEKDFNDKVRIQQAGMTYANSIGDSGRTWIFAEGGYLDEEWLGANIWARYYGEDGRWWIGARLSEFHDRDPYSFAGLTEGLLVYYNGGIVDFSADGEEWRPLAWLQAGYHIPDLDLDIEADYGRFVDNDKGFKVSLTRHWDDTALGFWLSRTDRQAPDKDFTKAGVHMEIPAEKWFGSWLGNSSSHIWEQDTMILSTWRMHSGREGGTIRTPERAMNQLRPVALKKNVTKLLQEYCSYDDEGNNSGEVQEVRSLLEYILH